MRRGRLRANVELMSVDEIKRGLEDVDWPSDPAFDCCRLKEPGLEDAEIRRCEEELCLRFSPAFRLFISRFDVGSLAIGAVDFCGTGDYVQHLIALNTPDPWGGAWWGEGTRPPSKIIIAGTDPYWTVLDNSSNEVLSLDPDLGHLDMRVIALDFDLFISGVGTVFLRRQKGRLDETHAASVHEKVGSQHLKFWETIT